MNKLLKQAFTLIELLVVIAIIGILSGLIIVSMNGVINSANDAKRKENIDAIRKALIIYRTSNGMVYPTGTSEAGGCNIGPVGIANRCANLASALTDLLPNLPVDPISGYYAYYSIDGSDFTLYSSLSSGKSYVYSGSGGYYTSIIARSALSTMYNKINSLSTYYSSTNVDDSTNGALSTYVSNFVYNYWTSYAYLSNSTGFTSGTYDIYARIRAVGSGTSTSFGVYDGTSATYPLQASINGLATSYQVKYIGRVTVNISHDVESYFYSSIAGTNYFIDYLEFRQII